MRFWSIPPLITAVAGVLALSACDERPPLPPFTSKAAPAADALPAVPETMVPQPLGAECCACPPMATPGCPEVASPQIARSHVASIAARPASTQRQAPPRRADRPATRPTEHAYTYTVMQPQPASYHPAPQTVDYGYQAHPSASQQGGYVVQSAPEPYIRDGYAHRHESYQGSHQAYAHGSYAHAPHPPAFRPPPHQPQVGVYESYSGQTSYSHQSSGYSYAGGGGSGPCCAGAPVQAAGRDSAGYLTWSGKRPPVPRY